MAHQLADAGRIGFQLRHDRGQKFRLAGFPALPQGVGRILHHGGKHAGAVGRQRRVGERGQGDLHHRLGRELSVFRRVEGAFDMVGRGGNDQPARQRRLVQTGELRWPVQCQMEFGGIALHADVLYLAHESGVEFPRPDKVEKGRRRVDCRDDGSRADFLAGGKHNARGVATFHRDLKHRLADPDAYPSLFRCRADRIDNSTHPAARHGLGTRNAVDLAGEAVIKAEQRGRRARTEMRAEHGVEGQQTLQPVVRKLFVDKVGDVHQQYAQEIAHVLAAEPLQRQRRAAERELVAERQAGKIGRAAGKHRLQHPGIAQKLRAQGLPCRLLGRARAGKRLAIGAVQDEVVAVGGQGDRGC
ncbi:MAG: hypothetical protein WBH51_12060 [Mycolicibacter algericus]